MSWKKHHAFGKGMIVAAVSFVMLAGNTLADVNKASATPSEFTQKGSGILGWHATSYGGSFTEAAMKANTDWIADNFKQYGYEYICVDGWVGDTTVHNADGYITTYKNNWEHDWKYWADYVHSKGLKLGMYYNPAWLHRDLVKDDSLKVVGTDIPLRSLVIEDPNNKYMHQTRYMVNPDAPGSKEYVQGMIKYYISVGVDLIKIDFLRYYETVYGHEAVKQLYGWIREAAGDDIILYYANTNNVNHAEDEVLTADILRASEDWRTNSAYPGVWWHTSIRERGKVKDHSWPPAYNLFDGLIWFSDLSGRGKVVIDGDYSVMSSGGTDAEKKTRMSLLAMSGSSINIGDRYSNIGDNDVFYTNPEILEMNKKGFVGKPLSRDVNSPLSQIWQGQLSDNTWIVALFNREDTPQERSIDFAKDLGLSGSYTVSDMWSHSTIGTMSSYAENVEPHGVRLLKITDDVAPVTKAEVDGTEQHGWYRSDAQVKLSAQDDGSGVASTEYNLSDAGSWQAYTGPITITQEGTNRLQYRSADKAGNVEQAKEHTVRIDKSAPTLTLTVNGAVYADGAVLQDSELVKFDVQVQDALSGIANQKLTLDGEPYANGSTVDFAGKLGVHKLQAEVTDEAGNTAAQTVTIHVKTSIPSMITLIDRYIDSGDISGALVNELKNALEQAQKAIEQGKYKQAKVHLMNFVEHAHQEPRPIQISASAKQALMTDAKALVAQVGKQITVN
ncbi:alpha-galactosidase [Paenibacillus xerothermodurans]|uniref:Alpha galactosidase C-terminal beta sandwich domain-containing protein n=1 Tax=Paenibacillus xerothermodurans TaxID=1977292 RepID=A0A2W1NFM3_PAEXE|nr:hypothetical protein [Paenibacillus xerothermodurans]PZE22794.1 hypothetical protein CBW46_003260 [Paenibacillus xerothermodurans]